VTKTVPKPADFHLEHRKAHHTGARTKATPREPSGSLELFYEVCRCTASTTRASQNDSSKKFIFFASTRKSQSQRYKSSHKHSATMSNIQTGSIVPIAPCVQVRREGVRQHSRRLAPLSRAPDAAMTLPVRKLPDLIIKTCAMPLRAAWRSRMPCHGRLLLLCDLHRSWAPVAAHVHVLCTYSNDRYQC
jgi:hypothetical protein